MSTLILEVQFIDNVTSVDKEFDSLDALRTYLNGQRETDYEWLCLHDTNTDMVIEGWSDIHQYINENTGEFKHHLSECSPACNCMYCKLSKSSSEAHRASVSLSSTFIPSTFESPQIERFSDLPDGAIFYLAQTYAYGGRQALIKTLEDGGEHNAVYAVYGGIGIHINDDRLVIRK